MTIGADVSAAAAAAEIGCADVDVVAAAVAAAAVAVAAAAAAAAAATGGAAMEGLMGCPLALAVDAEPAEWLLHGCEWAMQQTQKKKCGH
jgi:hypothetical protein